MQNILSVDSMDSTKRLTAQELLQKGLTPTELAAHGYGIKASLEPKTIDSVPIERTTYSTILASLKEHKLGLHNTFEAVRSLGCQIGTQIDGSKLVQAGETEPPSFLHAFALLTSQIENLRVDINNALEKINSLF